MMALELLGVGVASRHHGGTLGNAKIGLAQCQAMLLGQPVQSFDRRVQELRIGREGHVLGLDRGVDIDPREVLDAKRAGLVRNPKALG
jgi:hypothetical protein